MSKTCDGCETQNTNISVPYAAHESDMARNEREKKRLWIALIIAIALIFASNAIWLYAWQQYDYSSEEISYSQDGKGTNIIGDSNNVNGAETNNSPEETN